MIDLATLNERMHESRASAINASRLKFLVLWDRQFERKLADLGPRPKMPRFFQRRIGAARCAAWEARLAALQAEYKRVANVIMHAQADAFFDLLAQARSCRS